jgi:hypothetical protein
VFIRTGNPGANHRVVPTDDPNTELVLSNYYELGTDVGLGTPGRNRRLSIAVREVATGDSTLWVPEQGGSESGVFYSSAAKYPVFYWEEGDQGGSGRWEVVHADGNLDARRLVIET